MDFTAVAETEDIKLTGQSWLEAHAVQARETALAAIGDFTASNEQRELLHAILTAVVDIRPWCAPEATMNAEERADLVARLFATMTSKLEDAAIEALDGQATGAKRARPDRSD